jgi:hypothetical protein
VFVCCLCQRVAIASSKGALFEKVGRGALGGFARSGGPSFFL